ncbi:site-specific integrase [Photobacterium marinum]|uniref:site-specific integrase n=1 Tax=Photobacterium marinum TaxID=1056511 RepID=UPI0002E14D6E|nr:site-specific integrase [Photobacterium marinum]
MTTEICSYIKLRKVKDVYYRRPICIDEDTGELINELDMDSAPIYLGNISFLFSFSVEEKYDKSGKHIDSKFIGVEPVDVANAFLIETALNGEAQDPDTTKQMSDALRHYFQFLADKGLEWDKMPEIRRERPTFRFKRFMEQSANINVRNEADRTDDPLAISTVKAYMRHVTNFYKQMIKWRIPFENEPFNYEEVNVSIEASASDMSANQNMKITTTDLRIKAKTQKEEVANHLRSMSEGEWAAFDEVLRVDGFSLRKDKHKNQLVPMKLSIEVQYQMMLMRYSGLRIEEAASVRKPQIFKPTEEQLRKGYVEVRLSPSNFNKTKGDKSRTIEVPSRLMLNLYHYIKSKRYRTRESKYLEKHPAHVLAQVPLFINKSGCKVSASSLTTRFNEICLAIEQKLEQPFSHKTHNMRATYAVFRLRERAESLMEAGLPPAEAWSRSLDHVRCCLGHESHETTNTYLKQAQEDLVPAHEEMEDILEYADSLAGSKFNLGEEFEPSEELAE